jgi:hypothetical protein
VGYLISLPVVVALEGRWFSVAADFMVLAVLIAGAWSVRSSRGLRAAAWILVASALAFRLPAVLGDYPTLYLVSTLPALVFCLLFSWVALKDVLFGGRIDVNRLVGAVCVYLLIGVVWAFVYLLLQAIVPGSFALPEAIGNPQELARLIYYSFVTLTTLGYGDISPTLPVARTLAYMEAAFGQLYLTILVAALVGMLLSPGVTADAGSRRE